MTHRSKVMQLANQEALRSHHEYIGTEHILLGLVQEGEGIAATVLKKLNIDVHKIRVEVAKIVLHGPGGEKALVGRLPHTPRAKRVIDFAVAEARALNHNYIGTEHLLLGLLKEEECVAFQVLLNLGLDSAILRAEILKVVVRPKSNGHGDEEPTEHKIPIALAPENLEVYTVSDLTPAELSSLAATGGTDSLTIHISNLTPTELSSLPKRHDNENLTLTDEQIELIRDRIRNLDELKIAVVRDQDFVQARRYQEEATALAILLKLYRYHSQ